MGKVAVEANFQKIKTEVQSIELLFNCPRLFRLSNLST